MIRVAFFLLTSFMLVEAWCTTIEVCEACATKTIQSAVDKANPTDTILVKSGLYPTIEIELRRPITLIGEQGAILDGNGEGYVLKILSDSISISGFKIINSGRSYTKDFAAIYAYRVDYVEISNVEIVDPFFGILLEKVKNVVVQDSKIYGISKKEADSGNGIHLWHCQKATIRGNEVYGLRDGIYLEFVDESTILRNYTHNNIRYGLHFMFSNNDDYIENTFKDNGAGVAVMFSKFIIMRKNKFIQNWGTASYGLLLKEIYDAEVEGNEFTENTIGIFIEGSTRINYDRNIFTQNGWAIKVSGGCYANRFFNNNFIGNSFDVSYNTKMNDNSFHGNYWSEYTGYDIDKDGVGDVPYRPVKLFSYIVNKTPETIILLRSLFVDLINFSEKVSPVFTPDDLVDTQPAMRAFQ